MRKIFLGLAFLIGGLIPRHSFAQNAIGFTLPTTYHFDREINHVLYGRKGGGDSVRIHSYFTNSGEYAGLRMPAKSARHAGWAIFNKNGLLIFFSDRDKTAMVISTRKMLSDLSGLMKWIKMDSVMAGMRRNMAGTKSKSVNSGITRMIGTYTAQQYIATDSSGRASQIWCAKVDFPVPIDYLLGDGAKWRPMISSQMQSDPLMQAVLSERTIVTDIQLTDSLKRPHAVLRTEDIRQAPTDFSTAGFTVLDYSNYSFMEIVHAEMRRHMAE